MTRILLFTAAAMLAATSVCAAPTAEDFGTLPAVSHVHLSPDGRYFSAVEPVNGKSAVVVFKIGDASVKPMVFSDADGFAADSRWINNDRLLFFVTGNVMEEVNANQQYQRRARAISVSVSGKDPVVLLKKSPIFNYNDSTADIVGVNAENPGIVYISAFYWIDGSVNGMPRMENSYGIYNLYSVNVDNGDVDLVEKGNKDTRRWLMDGHGHVVARVDQDKELRESLVLYDHGAERTALTADGSHGEGLNIQGLSADGTAFVSLLYSGKNAALTEFPLSGSSWGKDVYANPAYDAEGAITDEWSDRVIGAAYVADKEESVYFDPARQKLQQQLERALPGQTVTIASMDAKGVNVIVASEDAQHPVTYWLYNSVSHQLQALVTQYPQLAAADLGAMRPYPYKARDGLDIPAYLTLPPGKAPRALPVVILPHGGPEARDEIAFNWLAQYLATRGYAVLQPNFRGSSGYGRAFTRAGDGEWGRKMQNDISDGVKKLIADGIADPKRICIVGASYGGYAALAGATFTPDLYACAVSYAGISSITNLLGSEKIENGAKSFDVAYWTARLGRLADDERAAADVSPAAHAANVQAPVLLLHSTKDVTVLMDQSRTERDALQAAGKQVQFIAIDGDDHYMNLQTTRVRVLAEIGAFLEAHIGH
jgi:dipeptidyl aminopeptidase/acylaminoacyl peptidase